MISNYSDYCKYLEMDYKVNNFDTGSNIKNFTKRLLGFSKIEVFLRLLRKVEYLTNSKKSILKKFMLFYYYNKFIKLSVYLGFSIPMNVFGPGLSIPHYGTIVVNPNAKIGKNCRLHVGVNIGSSGGSNNAPKIGDNCYIGPGTIIFGDIEIGDNISISANSTVFKSFSKNDYLIAGSPAKYIKEEHSSWWKKNKLVLNEK